MRRSTLAAGSKQTISPTLAGLATGLAVLVTAAQSQANFHVPHTQAGTKVNDTDGQCSLYEAIDAINQGKTAPGASLHGCVNDEGGGPVIEVEGDGTHYKTFGATMNVYME